MRTKKKVASWDDKQKDSFLATTNKKETERSAEGGHGGVYAGANAGGPARGYGFEAGVEADSFGAVDGVVAEEGALPAAEAVEGHGDGDGYVDAYHADLDAVNGVAGGVGV